MDWLMGKARGVSRGLMNTNASPAVQPDSPVPLINPSGVVSNSARTPSASRAPGANATPTSELERKSPATSRYVVARSQSPQLHPHSIFTGSPPKSFSQTSRSSPENFSNPNLSNNSPQKSPNADGECTDYPLFMKSHYLNQQLSLVAGSSFATDFPDLIEPFPCMERNEWLAAHTIGLFENLSTMFDALYELCLCPRLRPSSEDSCHSVLSWVDQTALSSPPNTNSCVDDDRNKKVKGSCGLSGSAALNSGCPSARQAIDSALSSCQDLIQSSRIFPVRYGEQFPADLPSRVTNICKSLLICIIHLYLSHFLHLEQLELIPHMNTLAKHFFAFAIRFGIIEDKEFEPLYGLHRALLSVRAPVPSNMTPSVTKLTPEGLPTT